MIRRLSALSVALLFCASTTIAQQNVQLPIEGKVINLYDGNSVTVLDFKKDFGGVCDGNTDDQPALDRAIEFINSLDKTVNAKGTTLQMPSGFCMLKKTWFIKRAMTVRGMGGGRDRAATTLVWPKGTVGIVVQSHDVAGDNGYGEGVSFEDFTVNALGPESPMVGTVNTNGDTAVWVSGKKFFNPNSSIIGAMTDGTSVTINGFTYAVKGAYDPAGGDFYTRLTFYPHRGMTWVAGRLLTWKVGYGQRFNPVWKEGTPVLLSPTREHPQGEREVHIVRVAPDGRTAIIKEDLGKIYLGDVPYQVVAGLGEQKNVPYRPNVGHCFQLQDIAQFHNVGAANCQGDGFHINASTAEAVGARSNANNSRFYSVQAKFNLGHGFFLRNNDSNAIGFFGVDASNNTLAGIWDHSFLGSHWYAAHTAENGYASIDVVGGTNTTSCFGCYEESSQRPPLFDNQGVIVGGTHGAGIPIGGTYITAGAIYLGNAKWTAGEGAPSGSCGNGSVYMRTDATPGPRQFICDENVWKAK